MLLRNCCFSSPLPAARIRRCDLRSSTNFVTPVLDLIEIGNDFYVQKNGIIVATMISKMTEWLADVNDKIAMC